MYFFGAHEPVKAFLFKTVLRPGMVVVDAGANVGQYTLIAAAEVGGSQGEVHSFEPVPRNFAQLVRHIQENNCTDTVRASMVALWDRPDSVRLSLRPELTHNAAAYTVAGVSVAADTVICKAVRLDDYVEEMHLPRVDIVKMDIEGSELRALQGAAGVIARWRPMMFMELSRYTCRGFGYEPERILEFLQPYGYEAWLISDAPERCRYLASMEGLEVADVILHTHPLPQQVTKEWSLRSILASYRHRPRVM